MITEEIRSYEVSLWTLQDEFITVLKWSDVEQQGRILKPKMTLNIDGTLNFEFSVPMYIRVNGEFKINPNWYTFLDKALMTSLYKVKVIFNKLTADEEVYEFIILDVTETHEQDILTCEVKCEGLAFHELGKIGYKVSLQPEIYEEVYNAWSDSGGTEGTRKKENILFWCELAGLVALPNGAIDPKTWYYDIQMNWKSFDNHLTTRSSKKIYEESYPIAWDDNLVPTQMEDYREKERAISIENSNLYNITQTLAETFEVFCRYEYIHDDNYHIIGKKVIFYNNFFVESEGISSFSYPHSAKKISRKMEGEHVTTKLYVLDAEDASTLRGYSSIMNADANPSGEDYILNFEYLYRIGSINKDLYDLIAVYEKRMRLLNLLIIPLQLQKATYENLIEEAKAKIKIYEAAKDRDKELVNLNMELLNKLTSDTGVISVTAANPDSYAVIPNSNGNYINLSYTNKGILRDTLKIYRSWNSGTKTLSSQVSTTNLNFEVDEYNNLIAIRGLSYTTGQINTVYLTYDYDPHLYYDTIVKEWTVREANDIAELDKWTTLLGNEEHPASNDLYGKLENAKNALEDALQDKKEAIKAFERLMGPALREGYWQPEDYTNYGDAKYNSKTLSYSNYSPSTIRLNTEKDFNVVWDSELFDEEEQVYYQSGNDRVYYPCINLDGMNIALVQGYTFMFYDSAIAANATGALAALRQQSRQFFSIGSKALLRQVESGGTIHNVLVLTGAKNLPDDSIERLKANGSLGTYTINSSTGEISYSQVISLTNKIYIDSDTTWFGAAKSEVNVVYPRIKFSSDDLKTDPTSLTIYTNHKLELAEDYYIRTRDILNTSEVYEPSYLVCIKPEVIALSNTIKVYYKLSNASTSIYLDAKKVSLENAYPKVSYEIESTLLNRNYSRILYKKLAQLVMINDVNLKLLDTFGYISELDLDLDNVLNDTIEVKNYKTKFEDLFSTIVAQTEEMKRSGAGVTSAISGGIPMNSDALSSMLNTNTTQLILQEYLDSYFDSSQVVKDRLAEIFTEAGEILANSASTLDRTMALTEKNSAILSSFALNVAAELTPHVYKGLTRPSSFKTGDIWILTDINGDEIGRYIATSNSLNGDGTGSDSAGFVRTYDGTLASITGAALNVNADDGIVELVALNSIQLKSGREVYIAADDNVTIIGNKRVDIGGTLINLCTLYKREIDPITGEVTTLSGNVNKVETTGINLIAGEYRSDGNYGSTARVLISPTKVSMGASELELKAASTINMIASTGTAANTSAIKLDANEGIWIGSGKSVTIFSGAAGTGASVELNKDHLLLGYGNVSNNSGNAIELDLNKLVIACGSATTGTANVTGTTGTLVGAKFTKESIGFATGSGNNINAILMNDNGVTIGSGSIDVTLSSSTLRSYTEANLGKNKNAITNGSYVRIGSGGIELGSLADLYINTDNFKLQTHSRDRSNTGFTDGNTVFAIGNKLLSIGENTVYDPATDKFKNGNTVIDGATVQLLLNKNGLYVKGTVYADAGSFTGDITANSFILNDSSAYTIVTTYDLSTSYTTPPSGNGSFNYTSKPTTTLITTYVNSLSSSPKPEIYLWTKIVTTIGSQQSKTAYSCEHINADGTNNIVKVDYTVNSTASVPSSPTWYTDINTAKALTSVSNPFLITRTLIFQNYLWNITYDFAKLVDDNLPYVDGIRTLYYLLNGTSTTPSIPSASTSVNTSDNNVNEWTTKVPKYPSDANITTNIYYYYTCIEKHWVNLSSSYNPGTNNNYLSSTGYEWDGPAVINYGLSVANQHATEASAAAASAATAAEPITNYGLAGATTWNGTTYALVLGNNTTSPMLIGSNGGVTIADTNLSSGQTGYGSSIVLQGGGIALHGSSINFTTLSDTTTNAVSLDSSGITMGTNGVITLLSNNIILNSTAQGNSSLFELKKQASDWTELNLHYDTALKYTPNNGLEITGAITATSLTVGSGNNLLTYNSTDGLTVKGNVIANTGTIGGFTISSNHIGNGATRGVSTVGLGTYGSGTDYVFWAGATTGSGNSLVSANFGVDWNGKLTATGVDISGTITATSLTVGSGNNLLTYTSSGGLTVKGTIYASAGEIAGWNLTTLLDGERVMGIYNNTTGLYTVGIGDGSNDYVFWAGNTISDSGRDSAAFSVKSDGTLKATKANITGTIEASAGHIGDCFIGRDFIGAGWYAGSSVPQSGPDMGVHLPYNYHAGISGSDSITFWAGGNGSSTGAAKFRVALNGSVYAGDITATGGYIAGWHINSNWLWGGDHDQCVTLMGPNVTDQWALESGVKANEWAMWAGADWPERKPSNRGSDVTTWAPFRVRRDGYLYAREVCVGNGPHYAQVDQEFFKNRGLDYDGDWSGYEGSLYFWVNGTSSYTTTENNVTTTHDNEECWKWIKIDGLQLHNAIEDINSLWAAVRALQASGATGNVATNTTPKSTRGCFVKGTRINTGLSSYKFIEDLTVGTIILSYDENTNTYKEAEVIALEMIKHKNCVYDIKLSNGRVLTCTDSHPILTTNGWKSLNPEMAYMDHQIKTLKLLIGDNIISCDNNNIYITEINYRTDLLDETVYHCHIEPYHTFLVENVVVHNAFVASKAIVLS